MTKQEAREVDQLARKDRYRWRDARQANEARPWLGWWLTSGFVVVVFLLALVVDAPK